MLRIDLLTLFPRMLDGFLSESILGKACSRSLIEVTVHDLRNWTTDKHRTADDRPFGGGAGMVLKPEPVFAAIEQVQTPGCRRIYLTPDGTPFSPKLARELAGLSHIILLSGHYEGIDQRIRDRLIDQEISIGDYVLTNGTLAAAVVIDALTRFIPGVLGEEKSLTLRVLQRQVARLSSIHASRRISRHVRARSSSFRKPRRDREVAECVCAGKDPPGAARFTHINSLP